MSHVPYFTNIFKALCIIVLSISSCFFPIR